MFESSFTSSIHKHDDDDDYDDNYIYLINSCIEICRIVHFEIIASNAFIYVKYIWYFCFRHVVIILKKLYINYSINTHTS